MMKDIIPKCNAKQKRIPRKNISIQWVFQLSSHSRNNSKAERKDFHKNKRVDKKLRSEGSQMIYTSQAQWKNANTQDKGLSKVSKNQLIWVKKKPKLSN